MVKKNDARSNKGKPLPHKPDPEAEEKKRLRSLALSKRLLRRGGPAEPSSTLTPAKTAVRLNGRDVVKRGQRKSRFLFSLPGLLAPLSGGRVGELACLASKNPVLYLELPQGRIKLFGTHVYPKHKYLTLQLTRSSKGVMCEDIFESLIVFSEAWWIGTKEENPQEFKLDFPKNLNDGKPVPECDFKGGAGETDQEMTGVSKPGKDEPVSPCMDLDNDDDNTPDSTDLKADANKSTVIETVSVRQSSRIVGKNLNYMDSSSDNEDVEVATSKKEDCDYAKESEFVEEKGQSTEKSKSSLVQKKEPLVQTTLSSLFRKAADKKKSASSAKASPGTKTPAGKRQKLSAKKTMNKSGDAGSSKSEAWPAIKRSGKGSQRKKSQAVDEPEEISSDSEEIEDDSDEDWAA